MTTSITYIVEHPPLQHILLFKDSSQNILYSTKLERHSFHRNKTHLYRGPADTGTHIATLENPEHIRLDTGVEIVVERPRGFRGTRSFDFGGSEYKWIGQSKVTDATGKTVAEYRPKLWSFKVMGQLSVMDVDVETLEVIIATFVALLGEHSKDENEGAGG